MDGSDQSKMMVMKKRKPMRVMVAMDESDFSFHALKWALDHVFVTPEPAAEKTEEASPEEVDMVVLVHVQEPFVHYGFPAGPGGTGLYSARLGGRIIFFIHMHVQIIFNFNNMA